MLLRHLQILGTAVFGTAVTVNATCTGFFFTIKGSTLSNRDFSKVNTSDVPATFRLLDKDNFERQHASGVETLAGTLCEPTNTNKNNGKLQVLFHSLLADRHEWDALNYAANDKYSYVKYMNNLGYPTLALDRIGNGMSTHPEAFKTQAPYEIELYHDLITQIRSGKTNKLSRSYSNIIWVGSSYGSELGAALAVKYPQDVDTFILTGFTKTALPSFENANKILEAIPAQKAVPERFSTLPQGYLTSSSLWGTRDEFFGIPSAVDFELSVAQKFYDTRDVTSVGQFLTAYIAAKVAPQYKGRVLVLDGEQDQAFCGSGDPSASMAACGQLPRQTCSLFPAADCSYQSIDRTGHIIQLHSSSQKSFDIARRFLDGQKFSGGKLA